MAVKVAVLDYDGTLVDSNRLKYEAYFKVFPETPENRARITRILDEIYELSRYTILEEIIRRIEPPRSGPEMKARLAAAAAAYNDLVMKVAINCPEVPGARQALDLLKEKNLPTYLSSNTPEKYLPAIIRGRGWETCFTALFGYPRKKTETVKKLLVQHQIEPAELVVIGDGNSDREAAENNQTLFLPATSRAFPFADLRRLLS